MKRSTKNMTLVVAALTIAAGTVSAQTMKAEIPFAFRVGAKLMQPGEYLVRPLPVNSGTAMFTLVNFDARKSTIAVSSARVTPSKEWTKTGLAKLSFVCVDDSCTLTRLWSGEGDAYNFRTPHGKYGEHIAEITLTPTRAD